MGALKAMFERPLEIRSTLYQMEALGVRSAAIASVTALFVGMVMAVQFAIGLQKFGGMEYTGRIIGLSFSRELAPTLTAVIVGGRIGAGIAAEVGSMAVTEQIDAIRALGANPVKKLVVPRLLASVVVMPGARRVRARARVSAGRCWSARPSSASPPASSCGRRSAPSRFKDYFSGCTRAIRN